MAQLEVVEVDVDDDDKHAMDKVNVALQMYSLSEWQEHLWVVEEECHMEKTQWTQNKAWTPKT